MATPALKINRTAIARNFLPSFSLLPSVKKPSPQLFRKFDAEARKVRVERFPYHMVFWHDEAASSIHVVAIAHAHRAPGYWRDRLP